MFGLYEIAALSTCLMIASTVFYLAMPIFLGTSIAMKFTKDDHVNFLQETSCYLTIFSGSAMIIFHILSLILKMNW